MQGSGFCRVIKCMSMLKTALQYTDLQTSSDTGRSLHQKLCSASLLCSTEGSIRSKGDPHSCSQIASCTQASSFKKVAQPSSQDAAVCNAVIPSTTERTGLTHRPVIPLSPRTARQHNYTTCQRNVYGITYAPVTRCSLYTASYCILNQSNMS